MTTARAGRPRGPGIQRGNAIEEGRLGWFVGQFVSPEGGLRRRSEVELKWGIHPRGDRRRDGWVWYRRSTTISILLEGTFLLHFREDGALRDVLLEQPGDYCIFEPGVEHRWEAPTDCTVLSVRFPSVAGDQVVSEE